jgi:hypothetical protein
VKLLAYCPFYLEADWLLNLSTVYLVLYGEEHSESPSAFLRVNLVGLDIVSSVLDYRCI